MTAQRGRWHSASLWVPVVLALFSVTAVAQTGSVRVYRSIDARGSVHFSDQPPVSVQQAEVIELSVTAPHHDPAVQERQQAAREVTQRIVADREQREAQRQRVYRTVRVAQQGSDQSAAPASPAVLPPVYPWVAWPVAPSHRNPYPYSVIRSRYRGVAAEVFNPR
jgi:hypothetical protein